MPNTYILARFSHGNEPVFITQNIAARLMQEDPYLDLVLPAQYRTGLIKEIAEGQGIDKRRIYIDAEAHDTAIRYGAHWGASKTSSGVAVPGPKDYAEWVMNNKTRGEKFYQELRDHYKKFRAKNLEGEEKEFTIQDAAIVLNAGDLYDDFGDIPIIYPFPNRHSELLGRAGKKGFVEFSETLRKREMNRTVNFIPEIHSLHYDRSYAPLKNEESTPHMKESPRPYDMAIPDDSVVMIFSGTGRNIETLKTIAAQTKHPIVTGVFSPVEGDKYIKVIPPRAEFVHVMAAKNADGTPKVLAAVGQTGYGLNWGAWNAGVPIIFPELEQGGDEEFNHNRKTILGIGLGLEISRPEDIDKLIETSQAKRGDVAAVNAQLIKKFGTLDGIGYMARRIRELRLY